MSPCGFRCDIKSRRLWDKAMGCWCSTLRDFLSPAVSRSVWPDMAWASGHSRQLPSGHVCGRRLQQGPHPGGPVAFLPKAWTKDQARLDKAGVPNAYRAYRPRHQLALELLAKHGAGLPQGWLSGDDGTGRPYGFRRRLATLGERYVLAVPSNTARRALETEPPASRGQVWRPRPPWHSVEAWSQALGEEAWHRIDVRDGRKGPLVVEAVKRRMLSRTHRRQPGDEEMLAVIRSRDRDQHEVVQVDYDLSNATPETPVGECARVAKAEHRMEECMQRSKSEAGLADYEVRHWTGWQAASHAFVTGHVVSGTRNRTGKKMDPCDDLPADLPGHRDDCARGVSVRHHTAYAQGATEATAT